MGSDNLSFGSLWEESSPELQRPTDSQEHRHRSLAPQERFTTRFTTTKDEPISHPLSRTCHKWAITSTWKHCLLNISLSHHRRITWLKNTAVAFGHLSQRQKMRGGASHRLRHVNKTQSTQTPEFMFSLIAATGREEVSKRSKLTRTFS